MSNPTAAEEAFLTTAQVAALTGWSVTSINRWAANGTLPGRKLPGRTGAWLFNRSEIERTVRERQPAA